MEHEVCKEVNNIRYLYKENGYRSWDRFCKKCGVSPVTMSKYNWQGVIPSSKTLAKIAKAFNVKDEYFLQERPQLTMTELRYGHHEEHHTPRKYTLDEFYDAANKVSEDFCLDRDALQRALSEHHN